MDKEKMERTLTKVVKAFVYVCSGFFLFNIGSAFYYYSQSMLGECFVSISFSLMLLPLTVFWLDIDKLLKNK